MRYWLVTFLVLLVDQLSKLWIVRNFEPGESRIVLDQVLYLTYVQNQGAAFGILPGRSWLFLAGAFLVVVIFIIINCKRSQSNSVQIITGLITAGAVGNVIDRIRLGYVIDFFDLGWWPVFNIADIAIVCGALLLLIVLIRDEKGELFGR